MTILHVLIDELNKSRPILTRTRDITSNPFGLPIYSTDGVTPFKVTNEHAPLPVIDITDYPYRLKDMIRDILTDLVLAAGFCGFAHVYLRHAGFTSSGWTNSGQFKLDMSVIFTPSWDLLVNSDDPRLPPHVEVDGDGLNSVWLPLYGYDKLLSAKDQLFDQTGILAVTIS